MAALYRGSDSSSPLPDRPVTWWRRCTAAVTARRTGSLAEVISYNTSTCKYEVEDIDEEQRERMVLSRRRVIPLPTRRANPDTQPEALFHEGDVGTWSGRG